MKIRLIALILLLIFPVIVAAVSPPINLELTDHESKWLQEHPQVSFTGDPNWLPYEAFDSQDNYIGIVAEHLELISNMSGINFQMSPSKTWTESTDKAKQGLVDVLSETDDSDLKSHLNFTSAYVSNPIVIAMKHKENFVENISDISDRKIALIKDYGYASKIRRKYSDIQFITVDNIQDGLISVSTGEIDALLCTLALCSYTISEIGLNNVKITGKTEFDTKLAFGVQKNLPELLSILNKAIANISREQQQVILDSWIKNKFSERTDYTLAYQVMAVAILLLSLFAFWIRRLSQEIHLRTLVEHKLAESKKRYQTLFDRTADALSIIEGTVFVDCNQSTLDMFGYETKEEFYKIHPSKISPEYQPDGQRSDAKADLMIRTAFEKGSHRFEWDHMHTNGKAFPVEVLLTVIPFEKSKLLHVVCRDISERKTAAAEIEHQAYYDSLTELPNRKLLLERLDQALITGRRHHHFGGLLFIDLDRFKSINDYLGHSIGDELLIEAAKRINSSILDEDTASRFGGDEYIVLLRHLGNEKETASLTAKKIASRIQDKFKKTFSIKGNELQVTVSIGVALFPFEEQGIDDIIHHADTAMYSAKQNGRNQIEFYLPQMHENVIKRLTLEKELRIAIDKNKLEIYYQPLVDDSGNNVSVEALLRWKHPEHGFINPEEFIAIAEDTGLIYDIGEFVLNKSITDISALNKEQNLSLKLSINISPHQFKKMEFVGIIRHAIENYQLEKDFLTLELTEHIALDNLQEAIEKFEQLRHLGVRLSLDDFGTGYSSLSHLKRLPIDELKIDRSFVLDIEYDPQDALLIKTIIKIAHQFGLDIVAEGVETKEQLAFLKEEKCHIFQGYYFSKPLPLDQLKTLLRGQYT